MHAAGERRRVRKGPGHGVHFPGQFTHFIIDPFIAGQVGPGHQVIHQVVVERRDQRAEMLKVRHDQLTG